jgi:GNAT superfamily N-acetyltransferase
MTDFLLVPLSESDLEPLLALYRQCEDFLALGPQAQATRAMVLADLALSRSQGGEFYGIYLEEDLAGVLDLIVAGFEGRAEQAYLELLMIAAPSRAHGLGGQVLAAVESRLRAAGVVLLAAHVQVNNPEGVRFWQRHGFQVVSEPCLQPDGTTTVRLEKLL